MVDTLEPYGYGRSNGLDDGQYYKSWVEQISGVSRRRYISLCYILMLKKKTSGHFANIS
jgi:hypothetical protein